MKQMENSRETVVSKITKRALIASAVCTLLSGFLLFSTSIAWFTAQKQSDVNELYSGNLDVELSYSKDMATWTEVTKQTDDIFKVEDEDGVTKHDMVWEPGKVNVVYFKVENKGSLDAEYDFDLAIDREVRGENTKGKPFNLSTYITCDVVKNITSPYDPQGDAIAVINQNSSAKSLYAINDTNEHLHHGEVMGVSGEEDIPKDVFALILYMPKTVGEEINYKTDTGRPEVPLKVILTANQKTDITDSSTDGDDTSDT